MRRAVGLVSKLGGRARKRAGKGDLLAVLLSLAATFFVNYFRCQGCVTFRIRGLQVSLTKTKDKVF